MPDTTLCLCVMRSNRREMKHYARLGSTATGPDFWKNLRTTHEASAPFMPLTPDARRSSERVNEERRGRDLHVRFLRVVGHAWLKWSGPGRPTEYRAFYPSIHEIPENSRRSLKQLQGYLRKHSVNGYAIRDPVARDFEEEGGNRLAKLDRALTPEQEERLEAKCSLRGQVVDIGLGAEVGWCDSAPYSWNPKDTCALNCSEWAILAFSYVLGETVVEPTKSVNRAADSISKLVEASSGGC
jgi:hypothetical protein